MRTLTDESSTVALLRARQLVLSPGMPGIDLDIYAGDRIAVTGDERSLAVLLRGLARITEPIDGHLWWGSKDVIHSKQRRLRKFRHNVGYIPANPYTLFDYHSAVEHQFSRAERQRFPLDQLAETVGLSPVVAHQPIMALSGATLVRVALMRMVQVQPAVLLVGDVFSKLAPEAGEGLLADIQNILRPEQGLLIATQRPELTAGMSGRIAFVDAQLKHVEGTRNIIERFA